MSESSQATKSKQRKRTRHSYESNVVKTTILTSVDTRTEVAYN